MFTWPISCARSTVTVSATAVSLSFARCAVVRNSLQTSCLEQYWRRERESRSLNNKPLIYSVFQKSDAKIEIIITATNLIRIKYPLSCLNYHLSGANVANFNKIHCTVFEQQLFKKRSSKTEVSNMEKSP